MAAAEALLGGETNAAFCGLRPPGHHAERDRAMGFCLFNNVAVAAAHALAAGGAERVLVARLGRAPRQRHRGDLRDVARVLYASIHQWPLYPGTGAAEYAGEREGEGYTVNLPVPPGARQRGVSGRSSSTSSSRSAASYAPDLIAISAGYDAHRDDPLASCMVETQAYGR